MVCSETCNFLDYNTDVRELCHIHHLESITAFSPEKPDVPIHRHKTAEIMTWLKMAADIHINLSNRLRIVSMVSEVMSYISSNSS